jgi:hypothetical protein
MAGFAELRFAAQIVEFENQLCVGSSGFCHGNPSRIVQFNIVCGAAARAWGSRLN